MNTHKSIISTLKYILITEREFEKLETVADNCEATMGCGDDDWDDAARKAILAIKTIKKRISKWKIKKP